MHRGRGLGHLQASSAMLIIKLVRHVGPAIVADWLAKVLAFDVRCSGSCMSAVIATYNRVSLRLRQHARHMPRSFRPV
jgi:hypothetical protein